MGTLRTGRNTKPASVYFITLLALILLVSAINFIADPGNIYLNGILTKLNAEPFTEKLLSSKHGVVQTQHNERQIKVALADHAEKFDCVIMGSSRVMEFSSMRNMSIRNQCENLLNLGVAGGGLEDIAIFAYVIMNSMKKPNKVFIGIDPWTLKLGMDSRWPENKDIYKKMQVLIKEKDSGAKTSYFYRKIMNLINFNYFKASIKALRKGEFSLNQKGAFNSQPIEAESFNYEHGYREAVTLPDGSHVYAVNYRLRLNPEYAILNLGARIQGDGGYKIADPPHNADAVNFFVQIIKMMHESGMSVNFIFTPYHENVFSLGKTQAVQHIQEINHFVRDLAGKLNIPVYGSYFPNELKCTSIEFWDDMHAKASCLNKIAFAINSTTTHDFSFTTH